MKRIVGVALLVAGVVLAVAVVRSPRGAGTLARLRAPLWDVPQVDEAGMTPGVREALTQAREALVRDPRRHAAWFDYAASLHAHALHVPADECYRRAGMLRPDDPRVPYLRALLGPTIDMTEAEQLRLLRRAAELDPRYPPVWVRLGELHADADRLDEARVALRRAVELDPSYPMAHRQLGLVLLDEGDVSEALRHLEFAAELVEDDYPTWVGLSRAWQRMGREEQATAAAERSEPLIEVMSYRDGVLDDVLARGVGPLRMDAIAVSYERVGAWRPALEALKRLERDRPDVPDVQRRLAAVYEALDEKALATIHRRRAEAMEGDR
jgi:tetratricopeptide (TPR) repeat protein